MAVAVFPRVRANTFDPDRIATLAAAFEDVCQSLARSGTRVEPADTSAASSWPKPTLRWLWLESATAYACAMPPCNILPKIIGRGETALRCRP
jgi:hypothetical protein